MKFKHTFHVFVDNFSAIYKHLLYGIIIIAVCTGLCCAIIIPVMNDIMSTAQYAAFSDSVKVLLKNIAQLNTDLLHDNLYAMYDKAKIFLRMLGTEKLWLLVMLAVLLILVYIIYRFLLGLGNYTTGALINDKMTLQADSSFIGTMIKNLGKASLYNIIYVPASILFDAITLVLIWLVFFKWLAFLPVLIEVFLFLAVFIALIAVKMTFTANWLPSLIHGRVNNRRAIANNFTQSGKGFANLYSNFLVIVLLILALNISMLFFTFGTGLLITIPASFTLLISFEFVNYYDTNGLKYFVGGGTIVGPKKETPPTIEEFFKGEQ